MKYVTADEMKKIDREAQEIRGIPSVVLMENAGRVALEVALDMLAKEKIKKVICICGKGNNGGDGFVVARHLINNGIESEVFLLGNPEDLKGDAKTNYDILKKMKVIIREIATKDDIEEALKKASLLIDAMLGTGLSGEVKEPYKSVIKYINESGKPVLALDIPSGLDATEGKVLGTCVKATKTVTFAFPKTGFIKNDGPNHTGEVIIRDIF